MILSTSIPPEDPCIFVIIEEFSDLRNYTFQAVSSSVPTDVLGSNPHLDITILSSYLGILGSGYLDSGFRNLIRTRARKNDPANMQELFLPL